MNTAPSCRNRSLQLEMLQNLLLPGIHTKCVHFEHPKDQNIGGEAARWVWECQELLAAQTTTQPHEGNEKLGLELPGCKCGYSWSRSANGDCSPGWCGDTCHSEAHTALGSSCSVEMLSVTLCPSSQLGCICSVLKLIHQAQEGVVGRSRGRTWLTSGSWQRVVQAPACRKPLPRAGIWEEIFWRGYHIWLREGLCRSCLGSQLSHRQTQTC